MNGGHRISLLDPGADPELIPRLQRGGVEVGFVGVGVAVDARVDGPLDEAEGGAEARGQVVADWVVEVVAEDDVVAVHWLFEDDAVADAVLVGFVEWV